MWLKPCRIDRSGHPSGPCRFPADERTGPLDADTDTESAFSPRRLWYGSSLILILLNWNVSAADVERPNIVIIFCDDLGYGDLSCFGHPTIRTPQLDRMASEGQKWTSFYCAAPVCTPSRAGLLTGRLPIRNGMTSPERVVLFPDSGGGLPADEITIAELLKRQGYQTACVGKWHLGHLPQFLPTRQGFDRYFGIPYSNDMHGSGGVPLMRDETVIERPVDQTTVTRRYTEEAVRFIQERREAPFFLYLAQTMPHVPLHASPEFRDTSPRGLYGDVVEEIDWSVGRVLQAVRESEDAQQTLVLFTSDNGPWLAQRLNGGSAGLLRAGKGTTFEGGMRVPTLFWWPGRIQPGTAVHEIGSTLDMLATCAKLAGASLPSDRRLDSLDLTPALLGTGPSPRKTMFFYTRGVLHAVRQGPYKLHFLTREPLNYGRPAQAHDPPLMYHVERDPSEQFDLAAKQPEICQQLQRLVAEHRSDVAPAIDQLAIPLETE